MGPNPINNDNSNGETQQQSNEGLMDAILRANPLYFIIALLVLGFCCLSCTLFCWVYFNHKRTKQILEFQQQKLRVISVSMSPKAASTSSENPKFKSEISVEPPSNIAPLTKETSEAYTTKLNTKNKKPHQHLTHQHQYNKRVQIDNLEPKFKADSIDGTDIEEEESSDDDDEDDAASSESSSGTESSSSTDTDTVTDTTDEESKYAEQDGIAMSDDANVSMKDGEYAQGYIQKKTGHGDALPVYTNPAVMEHAQQVINHYAPNPNVMSPPSTGAGYVYDHLGPWNLKMKPHSPTVEMTQANMGMGIGSPQPSMESKSGVDYKYINLSMNPHDPQSPKHNHSHHSHHSHQSSLIHIDESKTAHDHQV